MDRRMQPLIAAALTTTLMTASAGGAFAQPPEGDPDDQPTLTDRIERAITQRAGELAGDPRAVREFVAAHVRPEPYDGVLRGAGGAYLTGAGNGADQALLAQALLSRAPEAVATRFASCELEAANAVGLQAEWLSIEAPAPDFGRMATIVEDIPDAELRAAFEQVSARYEQVRDRLETDSADLADELVAAGWEPAAERAGQAASADLVPATHVWLQVERDGAWSDLDTTTPDGSARCVPSATFEDLPTEIEHVLTVRVVAETLDGGALAETTALELSLPTAELTTSRIAFVFGEPSGLIESERSSGAPWAYTPVLRIDNETIAGEALLFPPILSATGTAVGAATDALGGLLGGDDSEEDDAGGGLLGGLGSSDPPTEDDPPVTAAWLEIEHAGPSVAPMRVRSEIFDRVGPAARGGDAEALRPAELVRAGADYAALSPLWQIGVLTGPIVALEGAASLEGLLLTSLDGQSSQLDALLRTFPVWHEGASRTVGSPTIVALGLETVGTDGDASESRTIIDALHIPGAPQTDAVTAAREALSVMAAEEMLLSAFDEQPAPLGSVAGVFRAARAASVPLVGVAHAEDLEQVEAHPDARARLSQRLSEGYRAVLPVAPPAVDGTAVTGWFVIDPATGIVRDQHQSGRHAQAGETAATRQPALGLARTLQTTACRLARPVVMATALTAVLLMPAGGDAAVARSLQSVAEQQRRLRTAADAACAAQGTPSG